MGDHLGSIGGLLFFAVLVYLFIREIRGYGVPELPATAHDAWLACARTLRGRFTPAGGAHHPRVDFLVSGRTAFMQFIVRDGRSWKGRTAVRVNVAGLSPGSLTLKSKGRKTVPPGAAPGRPEFDAWFAPAGAKPPSIASRLITAPIKERLAPPLLALRRFGAATVELGEQSLSLEVGALLMEESSQLELASAMNLVMECFFGSSAPFPIELVEVQNPECPRCSICRGELREGIVRCIACQTPHHEDCWRFNSRCSTYGCGETRFFR